MAKEEKEPKKVSRRQFVKGAAVGGAGVAAAGVLASCGPAATPVPTTAPVGTAAPAPTCPPAGECPQPAWLPAQWDYEADVVVVGYGGAGAAAAVAASDAGAEVIVLEKAPTPDGGNSAVSGGYTRLWSPLADFITIMKMACWGTVSDDELITATCTEITNFPAWIESLGGKTITLPMTPEEIGLPTALYKDFVSPALTESYVLMQKPDGTAGWGADLFAFFHGFVADRGIKVMLATPAKELIQDPATKEILGVKAQTEVTFEKRDGRLGHYTGGREIYVKARKGVVMALGGYENAPEMRKNFMRDPHSDPVTFWGTPHNTGDGVFMASRVGAKLWHMSMDELMRVDHGPKRASEELGIGLWTVTCSDKRAVFVNRYGKRFGNEQLSCFWHSSQTTPFANFSELFLSTDGREFCDYPNIPYYMIFDDTLIKAGPFTTYGYASDHKLYTWSPDNSAEIEKGWIIKADTIEELGKKITCKDYFGRVVGMDAAGLVETVNKYNQYCAAGEDLDFGRYPTTLVPISTPPFYAMELVEGHVNTNGGAQRNKYCQVLDVDDKPIARLYSAGEFGSIFGFLYYGAGNIPEAYGMGRVAGEQAAGLTSWD